MIGLLLERGSVTEKLIALCWLHEAEGVPELLAANPGLVVPTEDQIEIANAAKRNDAEAVRLMLQAGLPRSPLAASMEGRPSTGRHSTANLAMIQAILPLHPPLEDVANDFKSTPLGWATHGSEHGWYADSGDYAAAVEALLAAGSEAARDRGRDGGGEGRSEEVWIEGVRSNRAVSVAATSCCRGGALDGLAD